MTDRYMIPLPGIGTLVLDADVFRACLVAEAKPAPDEDEPLSDTETLARQLSLPSSWIEQAAREGRIPSVRFGRWRRFRRSEVEAAIRATGAA
jgi:excisionase family DNA binding protein